MDLRLIEFRGSPAHARPQERAATAGREERLVRNNRVDVTVATPFTLMTSAYASMRSSSGLHRGRRSPTGNTRPMSSAGTAQRGNPSCRCQVSRRWCRDRSRRTRRGRRAGCARLRRALVPPGVRPRELAADRTRGGVRRRHGLATPS